jgi:hypothetical protein
MQKNFTIQLVIKQKQSDNSPKEEVRSVVVFEMNKASGD